MIFAAHMRSQLRLKQMIEVDSSSRARVLQAQASSSIQSCVCLNAAYAVRRDAWLRGRRNSAAAALQAAARVLHAHAFIKRCRAAELVQGAWRQHSAMALARCAGGKVMRLAAVKIQSSWRGHWLRVKKVCVFATLTLFVCG